MHMVLQAYDGEKMLSPSHPSSVLIPMTVVLFYPVDTTWWRPTMDSRRAVSPHPTPHLVFLATTPPPTGVLCVLLRSAVRFAVTMTLQTCRAEPYSTLGLHFFYCALFIFLGLTLLEGRLKFLCSCYRPISKGLGAINYCHLLDIFSSLGFQNATLLLFLIFLVSLLVPPFCLASGSYKI